jgi:hypothetical protein
VALAVAGAGLGLQAAMAATAAAMGPMRAAPVVPAVRRPERMERPVRTELAAWLAAAEVAVARMVP